MTSSVGGGAVNLATLWVPVLPEVSGFAGALAEGVVGGATMAVVNKFLGIFGEMVSKAVEGVAEIAKGVVEIGDIFDELNKKVVTFTDATGPALEQLKDVAGTVFSKMDIDVKNLGETMDVLHQRLGLTGSDLEKMTYDFEELTSRMGNLDPRQFTAVLDAFNVDGAHADAALRTLAGDAQHFGDTLGGLASSMATSAPVFELLGINFNSGAEAMAKIDALGPNAMKVMNGLASSGKEFAKMPTGAGDFKKFIQDTIDAINWYHDHNRDQEAEQLSADMFGIRQWAIVLRSLQSVKEAMDGVGSKGREINVDKFVEDTRVLGEQWTLFVHQLETDLKPLGETVVTNLISGLKGVGTWIDANKGVILVKIKSFGDSFIQALPGIQLFVGESVRLLGTLFDVLKNVGGYIGKLVIGFGELWGAITGDDKLSARMNQLDTDMSNLLDKDTSKYTSGLADLIETPFDPNKIQQKYDEGMNRLLADSRAGLGTSLGGPRGPAGTSKDPVHVVPHAGDSGVPPLKTSAGDIALQDFSTPLPPSGGPANLGYKPGWGPHGGYDAPSDPRNLLPVKDKASKGMDPGDLLGPVLDMLGFGNVLGGTNPENWGIVKFFKSLMSLGGGGSGSGSGSSSGSPLLDALGLGHVPGLGGPGGAPGGPDAGPAPGAPGGPSLTSGPGVPGGVSGAAITPWWPPGAPKPATSYDKGGTLVPGDTHATNSTGGPEVVLPPGGGFIPANPTTGQGLQLTAALKAQGFSDSEITGLVALNNVETGNWAHPESIMGLTDNQTGPGIEAHVKGFKDMWDKRQAGKAVPSLGQPGTGVDAKGNITDPKQYANWLLKMEGYSATTDWAGNKYAPGQFLSSEDYANRVSDAYRAVQQGAAAVPPGGALPRNMFPPGTTGVTKGGTPIIGMSLSEMAERGITPVFGPGTFDVGSADRRGLHSGAGPGGSQFPAPPAMPGAGMSYSPDWLLAHGIPPMFHKSADDIKNAGGAASPATIPAWAYQLGAAFGLTPKDHGDVTLHGGIRGPGNTTDPSASWAFDFFPTDPKDPQGNVKMQQLSDYLAGKHPQNMIQLIHGDPDTGRTTGVAGGQVLGQGQYYTGKGGSYFPDESDEVHAAFAAPVAPPGVSAGPNVAPGGGAPGGGAYRPGGPAVHFDGDYMPIHVAPSAIDPKPALKALQEHQISSFHHAGGLSVP